MRLGEALTVRRRQAEKLNDLNKRIQANALVQEGDEPQEGVLALIQEFERLSEEHGLLVLRINQTNQTTLVDGNDTLLALLGQREHFNRVRNVLARTADSATPAKSDYRFMRTEIKFKPTLNIEELRQRIDGLQEIINAIDAQIQTVNWETDLVAE